MFLKYCKNPDCNKMFMAKVNQTQRCNDCAKAHRKALQAVWREEHREHIRDYNNRWTAAQCYATSKMKVIRRERLKGISEIDTLRVQNKELAEIIEKLLIYTPASQYAIDFEKLRERIDEIKNNPVKSDLGAGARLPRPMVTASPTKSYGSAGCLK